MDGVEILVNDADYAFFASDDSEVQIIDGYFSRQFLCTGDNTCVAICGGTFNDGANDVAFDDINESSTIFIGNGFSLNYVDEDWYVIK